MDDGAERATHLVKRPWTPEEDEALVAAVTKYGACRWSMIATHLESGRVGKQCRERWNNHLCPEVKKSDFSDEDDRAILIGVAELGTRWCEIVKRQPLVGRTDNAIKNRFYALQRRSKARYSGTWGRRELLPLSLSSPLGKRKEGGEAAAADALAMPPPPPPEEAGRDSAAAEVINRREAIVAIATELVRAPPRSHDRRRPPPPPPLRAPAAARHLPHHPTAARRRISERSAHHRRRSPPTRASATC